LQFKKDEPVASERKKEPEEQRAENVNQVYQRLDEYVSATRIVIVAQLRGLVQNHCHDNKNDYQRGNYEV
jgi:hypothetical protein